MLNLLGVMQRAAHNVDLGEFFLLSNYGGEFYVVVAVAGNIAVGVCAVVVVTDICPEYYIYKSIKTIQEYYNHGLHKYYDKT